MAIAAPAKSAVTLYAESVISGDVVAGELVKQACQRHIDDITRENLPGSTIYFDEDAAQDAIDFFPFLVHSKGEWAGESFHLEPWQQFIIGSIFGWKRTSDDQRRFRTALMFTARKNGKTTLAAGLGLKLGFFDNEPGAEIYAAATKRDQAKICWSEAERMVKRTPALSKRITAFVSNLHVVATASKFEPLSSDYNSMDGLNTHGAIIDEFHAHQSGALADVLESSTGSRRQPLMFYTTTAGHDNVSACHDLDQYAQRVLDGTVEDDTLFAYIARIDEGDAWDDPEVWPKSNPNLGVSVKLDDLIRMCQRAKEIPREQNEFRRKRCNQWTEQAERWLDIGLWDECAAEPDIPNGAQVFAGLDLSTTTDLSALVLLYQNGLDYDVICRFWCPEEGIQERSRTDRVPYDVWARQGFITTTHGNVIDYDVLRADINDFADVYQVQEIGFDKWNATQLATQLMGDGANMVAMPQNYSTLNEPSKELEKLLRSGRIRHGGNPVLRWMAANVATDEGPNESIRPSKKRSNERIDGIVALVMALGRAMVHQESDETSVYERRGLLVF